MMNDKKACQRGKAATQVVVVGPLIKRKNWAKWD